MVYFIQDKRTNAIKIGYTAGDPRDRMSALQTGNPTDLVLLAQMEGDMAREAELHEQFAAARMVGEWFNPVSSLLEFMLLNASRSAWHDGAGAVAPNPTNWLVADESWSGDVAPSQCGPKALVVCPVCGCDYNHIGRIRDVRGWDKYQHGKRLSDSPTIDWSGRGSGVAIEISGECGHEWLLCLGFHKGNTSMFVCAEPDRAQRFESDGVEGAAPSV